MYKNQIYLSINDGVRERKKKLNKSFFLSGFCFVLKGMKGKKSDFLVLDGIENFKSTPAFGNYGVVLM